MFRIYLEGRKHLYLLMNEWVWDMREREDKNIYKISCFSNWVKSNATLLKMEKDNDCIMLEKLEIKIWGFWFSFVLFLILDTHYKSQKTLGI